MRNARTACLPGTREGIVNKLTSWVEDPLKKHRVCWVAGGAGVGKSAIAQTICETFPHQLATSAVFWKVGLSTLIDDAVQENPGELRGMNLEGQLQSLISQPCVQIDAKKWKELPKLIVIDGLDECMGSGITSASQAQETLLSIIHNAVSASSPIPFQFMIFSRPESAIRDFFNQAMLSSHEPVDMRDYRAGVDSDIRKYLETQFNDIIRSHPRVVVKGVWPEEKATIQLVDKADGHFIYVITLMKYITSNNPSPTDLRERLDIALHTAETTSHPDLSDLDQLYHTILRRFSNGDLRTQLLIPLLQLVITPLEHETRITLMTYFNKQSRHLIATLLKIDFHQCSTLLSQLHSVLHVPDDPHNRDVAVLHASFSDFLVDGQRSHEFQVQPLLKYSYFEQCCCCLLFILKRKLHQHQRGEYIEPADWILELSSLNSWQTIIIPIRPENTTILSEELLVGAIDFDLYGYSNMMLDIEWAKKAFRGCQSMTWKRYLLLFGGYRPGLQYHKHRIGPAAKRREFFYYLFMVLLRNLSYIRKGYTDLKNNGMGLHYNYFTDDWLVILPKDKENRKISLSRLGCIAALGSLRLPPPSSLPRDVHLSVKLFPQTAIDSWSIASPLYVLPHKELERATTNFSGDNCEFRLVRRQQREQFVEELAKFPPAPITKAYITTSLIPAEMWRRRRSVLHGMVHVLNAGSGAYPSIQAANYTFDPGTVPPLSGRAHGTRSPR
ncbi:hypothetical protein PQX77_020161 [Marasmius sp. AFHP31]|nr:hypothetical protein PQX77_020161 [Marasmius sp. AFHP31]